MRSHSKKKFFGFLILFPALSCAHLALADQLDQHEKNVLVGLGAASALSGGVSVTSVVTQGVPTSQARYAELNGIRLLQNELSWVEPERGANSPRAVEIKKQIRHWEGVRNANLAEVKALKSLMRGGLVGMAAGLGVTAGYGLYAISDASEKHLPSAEGRSLGAELAEARVSKATKESSRSSSSSARD